MIFPDKSLAFSGDKNKLEPEFREPYDAWKSGDSPETRRHLLKAVKPVLDTAVSTYGGGGSLAGSYARTEALKAFGSYNPEQGSMKNHLLSQLRRLQRRVPQVSNVIAVPERVMADRRHLQETEDQLADSLGRSPSSSELANASGLSVKRLAYIRNASSGVPTGSYTDEAGDTRLPASTIPGQDPAGDAWQRMVYDSLPAVDQAIMDMSLGLHGTPVQENRGIAKKLGLSPGAISQRKKKIQQLIDQQSGRSLFEGVTHA